MILSDDLAHRIYQSILDGSGDAVNLRDFGRYLPFFELPSSLETFEGRMAAETPEELRTTFNNIQQGLRDIGATRMVRTCSVAQFDGPETIRGVHETRLTDDEDRVIETYSGMCTLRKTDDQWRVSLSQFVEDKASLPSKTLWRSRLGAASATV